MGNRYLVKIASDLTKKERRLLDSGRDRYVNQAALWSTAGALGTTTYLAGKVGYDAFKSNLEGADLQKLVTDKIHMLSRNARNAALAFGAGGAALAGIHNHELNKLKKSHPQEYDTALAGSDRKGYVASSLNSGLAGSAMGGLAIPAAVANVAETAYHNHLVTAARKRQQQGYGG